MAIPEPWVPEPDTAYIRYDEHVAKLAEIRAAVEAEREAASEQQAVYAVWHVMYGRTGAAPDDAKLSTAEKAYAAASAALDALLSEVAP